VIDVSRPARPIEGGEKKNGGKGKGRGTYRRTLQVTRSSRSPPWRRVRAGHDPAWTTALFPHCARAFAAVRADAHAEGIAKNDCKLLAALTRTGPLCPHPSQHPLKRVCCRRRFDGPESSPRQGDNKSMGGLSSGAAMSFGVFRRLPSFGGAGDCGDPPPIPREGPRVMFPNEAPIPTSFTYGPGPELSDRRKWGRGRQR